MTTPVPQVSGDLVRRLSTMPVSVAVRPAHSRSRPVHPSALLMRVRGLDPAAQNQAEYGPADAAHGKMHRGTRILHGWESCIVGSPRMMHKSPSLGDCQRRHRDSKDPLTSISKITDSAIGQQGRCRRAGLRCKFSAIIVPNLSTKPDIHRRLHRIRSRSRQSAYSGEFSSRGTFETDPGSR
jgi:hypothetical protein